MEPIAKILLTALASFLFAVLARLGVTPPETFTQTGLVAVLMMIVSTMTIVWRWPQGAPWWTSKIIWTNGVAILFAFLALFGIVPALDQADVVNSGLILVSLATGGFALTSKHTAA